MTINEVLKQFREKTITEREKGASFERLMKAWLKTDPRYAELFSDIWLWDEFPSRADFGGKDTGIDLVAKTNLGDYWAIQCKCYAENAIIDKPAVDSFLATSSRTFWDETHGRQVAFAHRLWISTTNKWGSNAEETIQNQNPPVSRIGIADLRNSAVNWEELLNGKEGDKARKTKKSLREHQKEAIFKAEKHYELADRGTMVMACGTGKTFTSLRLIEHLVPQDGLVLFMVPSIALLGQALNDYMADSEQKIKAICICSDSKVNKKTKRASSSLDEADSSVVDLALPASTNTSTIVSQLRAYQKEDGLTIVFSTYQSIEVVAEAQKALLDETKGAYGTFDFIVCDEAHRTTGVKISNRDESNFTKIHSDEHIKGKKRLYMTATPRIYSDSVKIKASKQDYILCSMDDERVFGEKFHWVNFSYAVENGILTDYKVLVLTVSETMIPESLLEQVKDSERKELNYDDTGRLIGVINGLSKKILGDRGLTWEADPRLMKRALAFTHKIGREDEAGTSKNIAHTLPMISQMYNENLSDEEKKEVVHISARHVDGSMSASEREEALAWLAEEVTEDPQECRVISNVRCLSEGVDVPALDAVLFLSARNSEVDVVQSVGRVMRSFRRGEPDEKKYGYIIIPIVVPEGISPKDALDDNKSYKAVWRILNALRSHDDHFNAHVNTIALNKDKGTKVTIGIPALLRDYFTRQEAGDNNANATNDANDEQDAQQLSNDYISQQLELKFGELRQGIYAKLVEKCGERLYWENWAGEVGEIARKYIERINRLVHLETGKLRESFSEFVTTLRHNLNPGITEEQCIEMLAQHLITRPVFEALFSEYDFVKNNSISSSMQFMIELLENESVDQENETLKSFYDSVKLNVGKIDNLEGKQNVIKNLYEKFFKRAFPLTVEKLGTVYTPIECVDFILHSVEDVLQEEFDTSLTNEGVHILDPFTGTGTFITRLLQSGLIKQEDLLRKYRNEIHANELVLLAYYIADVNIESVFQELIPQTDYVPFDGLCLTDTFQLGEEADNQLFQNFFRGNSEAVEEQRRTPVRVIIGNPPYSIGQKSANDNAQNQKYPILDRHIEETYVAKSSANLSKGAYDSYIRAFRWSTDRLDPKEGSIIAFISNGAWLDGLSQDGFRASLEEEFDKIYVYNLRGNQRTSGELSRKEGGKIFGEGSRTPIAITFLIRYPEAQRQAKAEIKYKDIGDYLGREEKLSLIRNARSIKGLDWQVIEPNEKQDWINQRDGLFDTLLPLAPKKKFDAKAQAVFMTNAIGVATNRDAWVYGFSKEVVSQNMQAMIDFYNQLLGKELKEDNKRISWTRALKREHVNKVKHAFNKDRFISAFYRPFTKEYLYYDRPFIESPGLFNKLCPNGKKNLFIIVSGKGGKDFSCLISNKVPDLQCLFNGQVFPLYWYEEQKEEQADDLFGNANEERFIRREAISDWFLTEVRSRFAGARSLTKEDIFYYVYGLLHSPEYRERFADDLRKDLPRIPIIERADEFMAFVRAGRELAELHLNYESLSAPEDVEVVGDKELNDNDIEGDYDYYSVEKMSFPKKGEEGTIIYNGHICLTNIPLEAYDYVVNGRSAIHWVMERYQITTDKKSGIKNNPNDWAKEEQRPRYILDLLLSVITLSLKSNRIISSLPKLMF